MVLVDSFDGAFASINVNGTKRNLNVNKFYLNYPSKGVYSNKMDDVCTYLPLFKVQGPRHFFIVKEDRGTNIHYIH